MIVAFDYDKTITDHAYELGQIASALSANGHQTMVVTGRKSSDKPMIADFLQRNGFPEMEIVTKDDKTTTRAFKERILREMGVDLHWDDDLDLPSLHPTKVVAFKDDDVRFGYLTRGG